MYKLLNIQYILERDASRLIRYGKNKINLKMNIHKIYQNVICYFFKLNEFEILKICKFNFLIIKLQCHTH